MSYKVILFVEITLKVIESINFPIKKKRPSNYHQQIEDFFNSAHIDYLHMNY